MPAARTPVDWVKVSQKYDLCISEQGMYVITFVSSGQTEYKKNISKIFNSQTQHLHFFVMIYNIMTSRYRLSSMSMFNCKER